MDDKTIASLRKELKFHAHGIGIPDGAAESFIDITIKNVTKELRRRTIITDLDLRRAVTKELKKYNQDLAYVYDNYDRII